MWRPEISLKHPSPTVIDDLVVDPDDIDESAWAKLSEKMTTVRELTFRAAFATQVDDKNVKTRVPLEILITQGFLRFVETVRKSVSLTSMTIACGRWDFPGIHPQVALMLPAVRAHPSLLRLKIDSLTMSIDLAQLVSNTLVDNRTLCRLTIDSWSSKMFGGEQPTFHWIAQIGPALKSTHVQSFSTISVSNDWLPQLLDALPLTLTTLDLCGSAIDNDSTVILRSLVNDNNRLPALKRLLVNDLIRYELETSESSRVKLLDRNSFAARICKEESSITVFVGCGETEEETWALFEAQLAKPDCPIRAMTSCAYEKEENSYGQHVAKVLIDDKCPLQVLDYNFSGMDEAHQHIVIDAIKRNRSLCSILIKGSFDADMMRAMSDAFMDKTMLRVLCIESEIGFLDSVSDERITHLSRCLPTLNRLERLDLESSFITDNGLEILLNVLPLSLRHLLLKNNSITAQSLPRLLKFMNESALPNFQLMSVERNTISTYRSEPGAIVTLMDEIRHAAE